MKIAEINQQHRQLLNIINNLHEAMRAGGARDKVASVVNELVAYTRFHFNHEERMLESTGYPAFADHKKVHQSMVKQVESSAIRLPTARRPRLSSSWRS